MTSISQEAEKHLVKRRAYPFQIELSYVLSVFFDQKDTAALSDLLKIYASYNPKILDKIEFIIIDDGSPVPVELPDLNLNITLVRATINKPWNSAGAKNLGTILASGKKVLHTDLDYEFPEKSLAKMVDMRLLGKRIYKFYIQGTDGSLTRPHPNTFLVRRSQFLEHFGYDEEFSGFYGFEDTMFYRLQRSMGAPIFKINRAYVKKARAINRERSYHSLIRSLERNRPIEQRKRLEWKEYGAMGGLSRKMLRFPWEFVEERERVPSALPKKRPHWERFWPLRFVSGLFLR